MSIRARLAELEKKFGDSGELVLTMPDGTQRVIRLGRGQHMGDLVARCLKEPNCEEATLMRQAVKGDEPGNGHLWELIGALLNSPETNDSNSERSE